MFSVTKEITFCYGHRLMNHPGKCRHLHGHSAKAIITLASETLNEQAMVCDFGELKAVVSAYVDTELDHNFLIHRDDPVRPLLEEAGERLLVIDEHPTAEVIARMIFERIKAEGYPVTQVIIQETVSAFASYTES